MKTYRYIISLITGVSLFSFTCCGFLDVEPTDRITPEKVWSDPNLINGVLVNLYDNMQMEDFNFWHRDAWRLQNLSTMSDEGQGSFQKDPLFDNGNATYTYEDELFPDNFKTRYNAIRKCNTFLKELETTNMDDQDKAIIESEIRFIRAFHYFTLVKRYGGVPLITVPQDYTGGDVEELQVPRDKEVDIYNFIVSECQDIAPKMPISHDAIGKYRATKGSAYSLCSRAALYAGSIAKYGKVQLDGLVGIPSGESSRFFQASFDASNAILSLGVYSLYDKKLNDKVGNYREIFIKGNGDNGEYIFQKQYNVAGGKGHDWDKRNAPFSYNGGSWGCGVAPTLEMIESYEYTDGSPGDLKIEDENGKPYEFNNPIDLFEGKDPRLFASVYLPGSLCKGSNVEWQRGIIIEDGSRIVATNIPTAGENYKAQDGTVYNISGKDGGSDTGDPSKTGFYQKKFWDETLADMSLEKSETPWPVFRLGEVYLNLAEAAMELGGKELIALNAVNMIRKRAGIIEHSSIDMEKVRQERKIELAFEGHRFWDMKRWRIAHLDSDRGGLNGFRGSALYPWYNIATKKYSFEIGRKPPKQVRIFSERNYYTKITGEDMNSNPKLINNPGYTN
ncbi:MAG: RagB/SusD family nutrient uptake outer membrane protein [Tannerellaceae bacterium]|jgi:hypothetical protein|nr:RagB/SusD family nutrient uptake outer membrane protein [Tannerellaceae bacterium]